MKKSDMVREFHEAFNLPIGTVDFNDLEHVMYRQELAVDELVREGYRAIAEADPEAFLDAMVDTLYFIYGTAVVLNYDIDEAFFRVHAANMRKLGLDGKVRYREDGKVLKPPGWEAPVLADLVCNLKKEKT